MMTVPNQKIIEINQIPRNKNNLYGMFNKAALRKARLELGGSAFKIWTYINENANGYSFALSQVDVQNETDVKKTAYHNAIKELTEKGYLVETLNSNILRFYEDGGSSQNELTTDNESSENELKSDLRTPVSSENELKSKSVNSSVRKSSPKSEKRELPISENEQLSSENDREILQYTNKIQDNTNKQCAPVDDSWEGERPQSELEKEYHHSLQLYSLQNPTAGKEKSSTTAAIQKLHKEGKSFEWISKALEMRHPDVWCANGYGLLFGKSESSESFRKAVERTIVKPIEPQLTQFEELAAFPTFGGNSPVIDTRPTPHINTGLQELDDLFGED